jgi:hypothetical protein
MRFIARHLPFIVLLAIFGQAHASNGDCRYDLVATPVRGLFESIPPEDVHLPGLSLRTSHVRLNKLWDQVIYPVESLVTIVELPGEESGHIERSFSFDGYTMWADSASLQLQRSSPFAKIPDVIPLVKKRGIPIQTFVTLMHMKRAGIKYGSLKHVYSNITSERTQQQLNRSPEIRAFLKATRGDRPPNEMIARAFPQTHSYQYFETFLTQSGHRIVNIRIETSKSPLPGVGDFTVYLDLEQVNPLL